MVWVWLNECFCEFGPGGLWLWRWSGEVGKVVLLEGVSQGGDGRGKERGVGEGYQESGGALSNSKGLGKMGGLEGQIDKPEVIG
jgi:hypothetical protein